MEEPSYTHNTELVRIFIKAALILAVFYMINLGIYAITSQAYFSPQKSHSTAQINYATQQGAESVILGSSRAVHHIDPEILHQETGLTFYNAGREGANASYQLGVLSLLTTEKNLALIVYEVGDFGKNLDHCITNLYPYYKYNKDIQNIIRARDRWAFIKFQLPMYAYNGDIFLNTTGDVLFGVSRVNLSGFEPRDKTIRTKNIELLRSQAEKFISVDTLAVNSFLRTLSLCRSKGIPIAFVYSPTLFDTSLGGMNLVGKLAKDHKIPFYDYRGDKRFVGRYEYFYDALHLNSRGAKLFSLDLARQINKKFNKNI